MNLFARKESAAVPAETKVTVEELPADEGGGVKVRTFKVRGGLADVWKAQADKTVASPGDTHPEDGGYVCEAQRSSPGAGEVLVTFTYRKAAS